eukprot:s1517_g1.t1
MGCGSSETPAADVAAAAEAVEERAEGEKNPGTPGTPKLEARERSRTPTREVGADSDSAPSAPSGSAPSSAAVPGTSSPATMPPAKPPPKRKAPGPNDGVTGTTSAALKEARTNLAKAKENDEELRRATEQRIKEAEERRAIEQQIKTAADRLPGHPEMEDDEEQAVLLPRALLHRLSDLVKALEHQGCFNERYMKQSKDDFGQCAESLADLYQSIKVPSEMFGHVASLADGVSYYAGEVKRMLSINKDERTKWNWDYLQPQNAKKPMTAYIKELSTSAAATSAATLGVQSDIAEIKVRMKSLVETMDRAAIATEKTATVLLQQGGVPMSPGPVAPSAPETPAPSPSTHHEGTPMGAPTMPDATGAAAGYDAYGSFPPQPPQQPPKGTGKGKPMPAQLIRQTATMAAPPMRPPAAPHPSAGEYLPGWAHRPTAGGGVPVPSNPPPEEIVVQWSGYAPMIAPNMNNDEATNPPLTYELQGEVPHIKNTSAIGIDRNGGRRRRISPEGKQLAYRNATSAAFAPKGWTQSVNTLLFHRVYENL